VTVRIALLTEIPAPFRIPLFNALADRADVDLRVLFLSDRDPKRPYPIYDTEFKYDWQVLPGKSVVRGGRWIVVNGRVLSELSRFSPDAIVVGGWNQPAFWQALAYAKLRGKRLIGWVESTARDERPGSGGTERAKRTFLAACDAFVVPGTASHEYLRELGVPDRRIYRAPNAVEASFFKSPAERPADVSRTILCVARLDPEKDVGLLIRAAEHMPDVSLVLAGAGSQSDELRALAGRIAPGRVRFLGFVPREELAALYASAGLFVLPSRSDQWGMVLNEAAAAGLPIVATEAVGAAWDLIDDGVSGARVPVGDEGALMKAIERFCGDTAAGRRSATLVERFTPAAWADGVAAAAGARADALRPLGEQPLVTVVTPCLNPGKTLEGCLASVAAQTYPAVEHLVIDGGSGDGTVERLRAAGVRFVSEPDHGQSEALNKGFRLAEGEIVGWLNADDTLRPDAVAAVVAALTAHPEAGWAYGDCEIVEPGERAHVRRSAAVVSADSFFDSNPIAQPGVFLTREAVERVGGVDTSLRLAMDFDLWLRLVDAGLKGVYVPQTLARFEISHTSKTGSVPWHEFLREEAIALARSGHDVAAAKKLGASAAWAAYRNGTVPPRELRSAVDDAIEWSRQHDLALSARQVGASAALSAARLEPPRSWKAARHAVRLAPWLTRDLWGILIDRVRAPQGWSASKQTGGPYDQSGFLDE
jgi:glycosyltransferase involved in cell wall biosynthesis